MMLWMISLPYKKLKWRKETGTGNKENTAFDWKRMVCC
jgi:hypothetical protein